MSTKRSPNTPQVQTMTLSPGETRLAAADSIEPVPDELRIKRSAAEVPNTSRTPAEISLCIAANSDPRWSIIGRAMARTTRSGSGVGPGIRSCSVIAA